MSKDSDSMPIREWTQDMISRNWDKSPADRFSSTRDAAAVHAGTHVIENPEDRSTRVPSEVL